VTVRRIGSDAPVEVVPPDELARRKEEAEWQRYRRAHGLDVEDEHARLALRLGDPVSVPRFTGDLWWFVRDVNGLDRTITAGTLIFDQPRERTFPFDLVELVPLWDPADENEAAFWFDAVQRRLGPVRRRTPRKRAA
jgi:hypothetical protein